MEVLTAIMKVTVVKNDNMEYLQEHFLAESGAYSSFLFGCTIVKSDMNVRLVFGSCEDSSVFRGFGESRSLSLLLVFIYIDFRI